MRLPYRRHSNGSGKIYGEEKCFVSRDSLVDRASEIHGASSVTLSRVWRSVVTNSTIHYAYLNGVILTGGVVDGQRTDRYTVDDSVRLIGPWSLTGPFYVRSGLWRRAPRHKTLSHESGIHVGLTESTNGNAFIACEEKPVTEWLKKGVRIGLHLGWPHDLAMDAYYWMQELAETEMKCLVCEHEYCRYCSRFGFTWGVQHHCCKCEKALNWTNNATVTLTDSDKRFIEIHRRYRAQGGRISVH